MDADQLFEQELFLIRLGHADQSPPQAGSDLVRVRVSGARDTPDGHPRYDVAEEGGELGTPRAQRRDVRPEENGYHHVRDQSGVEQLKPLVRGQWQHARAGYPPDVILAEVSGHAAGLGPQTPRHRHTRQPPRPAPGRQAVQEHVRRRVVALPGTAQHTGGRGEQHERRQVHPRGQLMQIPRRVHLRPQHRLNPLTRQRRQQPVVEHTRRMHHTTQTKTLRQPRQHPRQSHTVRGVTRRDHHFGAGGLQPGAQLGRTLGLRTTTGQQHQLLDAVPGHQMPRHQPAQHTCTARHEHRSGTEHPRLRSVSRRQRPAQTRHPHRTRPHQHLLLTQSQHPGENVRDSLHVIGVHQHQEPGILRLSGPHQAPHRSPRHVRHAIARIDSAPGHHHQPLTRTVLVRQPPLDPLQDLKDPPVHLAHHVRTTGGDPHNLCPRRDLTRHASPGRVHPLDPEQRIPRHPAHGVQLSRVNRTQHQRLDRRHPTPRLIPHQHRHGVRPGTRRRQPHAQRCRTNRLQSEPTPGERQQTPRTTRQALAHTHRVQRRVEQRRMQPELACPLPLSFRELDLREHLTITPPRTLQPLENRPILQPVLRGPHILT
ncbi:hypothetical protein GCM10009575_091460 [Streptomyces rhizosphaericus]|uniref:Uncharacterized protein n=1 Tax=Streptomyces rhizosphaericus TaxID=114699 RepID=A0ABN1RKV1_9ACTN